MGKQETSVLPSKYQINTSCLLLLMESLNTALIFKMKLWLKWQTQQRVTNVHVSYVKIHFACRVCSQKIYIYVYLIEMTNTTESHKCSCFLCKNSLCMQSFFSENIHLCIPQEKSYIHKESMCGKNQMLDFNRNQMVLLVILQGKKWK